MAELVFFRNDQEIMHVHLASSSIKLGRGGNNDISFPESERLISREHLEFYQQGTGYRLRDLTGKGFLLNGSLQQGATLSDGDQFELGSFRVLYLQQTRADSQQVTAIQPHGDTVPLLHPDKADSSVQAILSFQKHGRTQEIILPQHGFQIGSSAEAHLSLTEPYISSFHCRIYRKQGKYYIRDLDSRNGTWVNGMRVVEAELPPTAEITLGQFPLSFQLRTEKPEQESTTLPGFAGIVGQDPAMLRLFTLIERMANHNVPVLIQGESGVGKELVARALHDCSDRRHQPFVALNCGAISKDLIESALFGHEKGAFTGAIQARLGAFEEVGQGTLFLDEIGDMPLEHQVTLLRVLETGSYRRVGGSQEKQSQARVVAATHQSLRDGIDAGWFREDLYYRLHVLVLDVPPLRSRPQDIPLLAHAFLQTFAGHRHLKFSPQSLRNMVQYAWPGNVRELRNTIQRAIVLVDGVDIQPDDIMLPSVSNNAPTSTAPQPEGGSHSPHSLEQTEKQTILSALEQSQGIISEAAKILGIGRSSLYSKMKKHNLNPRTENKDDDM